MLGDELPSKTHLQNHIGICSPHKAVGLYSFKYSMIVYNNNQFSTLEQWSDVLCGSLNETKAIINACKIRLTNRKNRFNAMF